jgi:hypothetical protein
MLGTRTKLDWAIAVVVSFHGQTTAAFAVPTALPVVPGEIAIMAVAHLSNSPAICSMVVHPRSTVPSKSEKTSSNNRWIDLGVRLRDRDFDGHRLFRWLFRLPAQGRGKNQRLDVENLKRPISHIAFSPKLAAGLRLARWVLSCLSPGRSVVAEIHKRRRTDFSPVGGSQ